MRGRRGVFVVAGLSFLTLAGLVSVGVGLFDRLSLSAKVEASAFECLEKGKWRSCLLPPTPYMLITSDIHLSSPSGRWPETTQNFRSFVEEVSKNPPEVIFVAGDVVDNAAENYPGSLSNWREEWEIYSSIREAYKGIQFRQSYGTGHDWLNGEMLAILDKDVGDRKGVFSWRGLNFVWLSFGPGAFFPNAPEHKPDLEDEDYHWLEKTLASVSNASLIFHVPLSTPLSTELGVFSGGRLIVLDPRDHLYKIIDTYRNKIDTIFSGHIHRAYRDEYNGIPIFSCPFMGKKNFCIVQAADKKPETRQYRFVELQ